MEMTPQAVRSTGFKLVKRGYDPEEVDAFKEQVAGAVEFAQNQATAMEARARAAVAKLQEVSQQVQSSAPAAPASPTGDTEMISRTLLLAQRTADQTVSDARSEAESIVAKARDEAGRVMDTARTMAAKTVDDARFEARRAAEDEKVKADNEVQSLLARRDFLLSDVDHLEQYLQAQRERLRDAAVQLQELVERVPGGLGDMRRPLLSASAEELPASIIPLPIPDSADLDDLDDTAETAAPARAGDDVVPTMASGDPDSSDQVWRMLDAEVANGRGQGTPTSDITGEMPRPDMPPLPNPFHIDDEDLQ